MGNIPKRVVDERIGTPKSRKWKNKNKFQKGKPPKGIWLMVGKKPGSKGRRKENPALGNN